MKELYKALAGLQQEVPPIYKGTEGYGYSYADWGQILEVVNRYMQLYKLGFTQLIDGTSLKTIIFHTETGESIESIAQIPQGVQLKGMNDFQVLGSAITYMRRYALSAALGLVTDKDADAAGEQVKPKATKEVRNRVEENEDAKENKLDEAKRDINDELIKQNYTSIDDRRAFIKFAIGKEKIETIEEDRAVATALEEQE